jgi:hypothetical protein
MDFTKVITHPLGLAGFALALIFGVTGMFARHKTAPSWLPGVAVTLGALCLIGGMLLAYRTIVSTSSPADPQQKEAEKNVANTQKDCAPALAGVRIGGSMILNCEKFVGTTEPASSQ